MRIFLLIYLFLLTACSNSELKSNYNYFKTFNNMTYDEFKLKLEEYSQKKPYPNIDY
jgi:hypothetical protein|tara:strand:- start:1250 stop:1420 length:171 start_codon:yes stop_codon:yes gene_type:complete